jgi:DNA repair exonuclease SbcCD ATPase subunit
MSKQIEKSEGVQKIEAMFAPCFEAFEAGRAELARQIKEVRTKRADAMTKAGDNRAAYEQALLQDPDSDEARHARNKVHSWEDLAAKITADMEELERRLHHYDHTALPGLAESMAPAVAEGNEIIAAAVADAREKMKAFQDAFLEMFNLCEAVCFPLRKVKTQANIAKARVEFSKVHTFNPDCFIAGSLDQPVRIVDPRYPPSDRPNV